MHALDYDGDANHPPSRLSIYFSVTLQCMHNIHFRISLPDAPRALCYKNR